jgi:hypothetical protein
MRLNEFLGWPLFENSCLSWHVFCRAVLNRSTELCGIQESYEKLYHALGEKNVSLKQHKCQALKKHLNLSGKNTLKMLICIQRGNQ